MLRALPTKWFILIAVIALFIISSTLLPPPIYYRLLYSIKQRMSLSIAALLWIQGPFSARIVDTDPLWHQLVSTSRLISTGVSVTFRSCLRLMILGGGWFELDGGCDGWSSGWGLDSDIVKTLAGVQVIIWEIMVFGCIFFLGDYPAGIFLTLGCGTAPLETLLQKVSFVGGFTIIMPKSVKIVINIPLYIKGICLGAIFMMFRCKTFSMRPWCFKAIISRVFRISLAFGGWIQANIKALKF